jgi:hypothetical protein
MGSPVILPHLLFLPIHKDDEFRDMMNKVVPLMSDIEGNGEGLTRSYLLRTLEGDRRDIRPGGKGHQKDQRQREKRYKQQMARLAHQ